MDCWVASDSVAATDWLFCFSDGTNPEHEVPNMTSKRSESTQELLLELLARFEIFSDLHFFMIVKRIDTSVATPTVQPISNDRSCSHCWAAARRETITPPVDAIIPSAPLEAAVCISFVILVCCEGLMNDAKSVRVTAGSVGLASHKPA